jgi:mono/diheme cytochrome c family protein
MTSQVAGYVSQPLIVFLFAGLVSCQMWTDASLRPEEKKGRVIFQEMCAGCHGTAGRGDGYVQFNPPPANLRSSTIQKKTDQELRHTIREGHADTAMGAWKYGLSEEEIQAVLMYIRTLRE